MDEWFTAIENKTVKNAPETFAAFKPLVFSTGGMMSANTLKELESWETEVGKEAMGRLRESVSVEVVKARARALQSCLLLEDDSEE